MNKYAKGGMSVSEIPVCRKTAQTSGRNSWACFNRSRSSATSEKSARGAGTVEKMPAIWRIMTMRRLNTPRGGSRGSFRAHIPDHSPRHQAGTHRRVTDIKVPQKRKDAQVLHTKIYVHTTHGTPYTTKHNPQFKDHWSRERKRAKQKGSRAAEGQRIDVQQ